MELRVAVEGYAAIDGIHGRRALLIGSHIPIAGMASVAAVEARFFRFHGWEYVSGNGEEQLRQMFGGQDETS